LRRAQQKDLRQTKQKKRSGLRKSLVASLRCFGTLQTRVSRTVLLRPDGSFNEMPLEDVSPVED